MGLVKKLLIIAIFAAGVIMLTFGLMNFKGIVDIKNNPNAGTVTDINSIWATAISLTVVGGFIVFYYAKRVLDLLF